MSASLADPHTARALAHRLIVGQAQDDADDHALVAAAERACTLMPAGMSRWFGPYGSQALMTRALARAVAEHPALAKVTVDSTRSPCLVGLADSAAAHGPHATLAGAVEVLAALASLIGRLIGDDLAGTLLEQSLINSSTPGTPGTPVASRLAAVRSESLTPDSKQP